MKKISVELRRYYNGDYQGNTYHKVTTLAGLGRLVREYNEDNNGWGWRPVLSKTDAISLGAYETVDGNWVIQYPGDCYPLDIEIEDS